jgi:hypothetical protein
LPENNLYDLLTEMKDSLEREIRSVQQEVRSGFERIDVRFSEMEIRFDNQAARMNRQAGLIQAGGRAITRTSEWAEKVDRALEVKDVQIAELRARLEKLEKP